MIRARRAGRPWPFGPSRANARRGPARPVSSSSSPGSTCRPTTTDWSGANPTELSFRSGRRWSGPAQMAMQEIEGADRVHAVAALEELDLGAVGQAELGIEPAHFCVFVGHPRVAPDQVEMSAFDHEGARH